MKRERGSLRTKANVARQRLVAGGKHESTCGLCTGSLEMTDGVSEGDCELYTKIAFLVAGGVANPLGHVLDKEYMEGLSDMQKERYVFAMSAKVRELSQRVIADKAVNQ